MSNSTASSGLVSDSTALVVAASSRPVTIGGRQILSTKVFLDNLTVLRGRGNLQRSFPLEISRAISEVKAAMLSGVGDRHENGHAKHREKCEGFGGDDREMMPSYEMIRRTDWIPDRSVHSWLKFRDEDGVEKEYIATEHFRDRVVKYIVQHKNGQVERKDLVAEMEELYFFRNGNVDLLLKRLAPCQDNSRAVVNVRQHGSSVPPYLPPGNLEQQHQGLDVRQVAAVMRGCMDKMERMQRQQPPPVIFTFWVMKLPEVIFLSFQRRRKVRRRAEGVQCQAKRRKRQCEDERALTWPYLVQD